MAQSKYSAEEKLAILTLYHDGHYSMYEWPLCFRFIMKL
ncbi:hypothetical protein J2S08_003831 [Bacillus chungangensis]|uniref:Helix-turn-helix domain-containing protein n=1 Tax=Bacillus chungangensis TaxID=587633 RepID=A0ABT9WXB9_9BACI|nr:hypothetical protein [Bacillus chungangensis]